MTSVHLVEFLSIDFQGTILSMAYKDPGFNDRIASAAKAKRAALEKLKARPPIDEVQLAARIAAREAKEAAAAQKRAEKAAERARIAAEKAEAKRLAEEAAAARKKPELSEAEKKALRDARYAARKQRRR